MYNTSMDKNLGALIDIFKWPKAKIAANVGVSDAAVLKWSRGASPSKAHQDKLAEVVQANRYYRRKRLNDYAKLKAEGNSVTPLRHMINCGVTCEELEVLTGIKLNRLRRLVYHYQEINRDNVTSLFNALCKLQEAEGEDKLIDLLDTTPVKSYDTTIDPEIGQSSPSNPSVPGAEKRTEDDNTYQVPW